MPSLEGAVAVVTGGSGYVGRRLIAALVAEGCKEVRSVDVVDLPSGFLDALSKKNESTAAVELVSHVVDIGRDYDGLLRSLEDADIVFHLASYGMSGECKVAGQSGTRIDGIHFSRAGLPSGRHLFLIYFFSPFNLLPGVKRI